MDNIYLHPEEEKYRKIKLQNKVFQVRPRLLQVLCLGKVCAWSRLHLNYFLFFQERISCLEGIHRFFQAIGFETKTLPVPGQGKKSKCLKLESGA